MGLEHLKRHAQRLNRFKQPLDAGYAARTTMHLMIFCSASYNASIYSKV